MIGRSETGRTLVTGASGALGRALVAALDGTATEVLALDRVRADLPGAAFVPCDVATVHWPDHVRPGDLVFHLAAFVHRHPRTADEIREVHEVNHHATTRLARACRDAGATMVLVSTVAVAAPTEYGRSKAAAEDEVRALGAGRKGDHVDVAGALRFAIVRFPLLYGPHGRGNMERMLDAIRRRRYWPIGDPATPKSCLYLDDAAQALRLAAQRGLAGTWVAAPEPVPTLGEIHAAAYAALGRSVPVPPIPRALALVAARAVQGAARLAGRSTRLPEQVETLTSAAGFDGRAFSRATGFSPRVSLEEGMRRTVAWMGAGAP